MAQKAASHLPPGSDSPQHLAGTVWPLVQILHQPPASRRPLGEPRACGCEGDWMVQAAPGVGPSLPGSSQHRGPRGCTRWAAVPTKSPPSTTRIELSGRVSSTSCSTRTGFRCWDTGLVAFSLQWNRAGQQDQQQTLLGTYHHPPRPPAPTERSSPSAGRLAEAPLPSLRPMSGPEGPPPASTQRSPRLLGKEEGTAAERWPPPALPAQEARANRKPTVALEQEARRQARGAP